MRLDKSALEQEVIRLEKLRAILDPDPMNRNWPHRLARTAVGLAVLTFLSATSAPACSAAVFNLTTDPAARLPDIAVDSSGTSHIAWNLSAGGAGNDQLVYCRVPRGAHTCDVVRNISLPGTDFMGPRVVLTRSGDIVLVSGRCCFPAAPVFAATSSDGGQSFGPPVKIAEEFAAGSSWEAELGPGDFSLALSGGNSGPDFAAIWRSAPLDGSSLGGKAGLAPFPKAYFTSTGFPAPTAPIAAYGDLQDVYLRRWSGSGDYNDQASWLPEEHVVHGSEPKLASGVRGVFLIYQGAKPPYQYFVRKFDPNSAPGQAFPKATQTVVSDPKSNRSAIFRDLVEDSGGNLHAVFRQESIKGVEGLRHRVSLDGGKSWRKVEILASGNSAENLFDLRVGASEMGGAVVGDHNDTGPVWFAPFGPSGGGGGACPQTVKLGKAIALATEGCFKREGKKFVASGAVKLNGVDIEPLGEGGKASASAGFQVTAIPSERTLSTSAKAIVRVGQVLLEKGPISWKLPAGNGKVVRLNSPDGSVFRDLGKFAKKLFEFPVDGDAELLIDGSGTKIPTTLRMPGLLGGVTGNTTLRTDQGGQVLAGMKIEVPVASIGLLHLAEIDVAYDGQNRFTGTAKVELPPAYSAGIGKSSVTFGFEDGQLSLLNVQPPPFNPALPIVGSPPSPLVGLDRIAFTYVRTPGSRLFQGDVFLIAGPKLFGQSAVNVQGAIALEFPASKPTTLTANGDLSVVRLPLGSAYATYTVPDTFKFGGSFTVLAISGAVSGFVDLAHGTFSASGKASAGPLSGEAVLSNHGFGACIDNPLGPDPGVSWSWSDLAPSAGCPGSGAGASASGAGGFTVPKVRARVHGTGRRRSLRFKLPRAAGQRVTFAEQSNRVYRQIGSSKKASGSLPFRPAPGPGGKRDIVAIVEAGGVPFARLTVTHYRAPPTRRLRAPIVTARRRGARLLVGWSRVRGARAYQVRINLPRGGRRLLFFPPPKKHRLKVKGLENSDTARVTVAAIGPDLRPGREGRATLKPRRRSRRTGRR
jgi:hypothetical protein